MSRIIAVSSVAFVLFTALFIGCRSNPGPATPVQVDQNFDVLDALGQRYFLEALDEIHSIVDWSEKNALTGRPLTSQVSSAKKALLNAIAADTTYIYGQVTPQGYGAVVTERHSYPKGLLLITMRRSYGKELGHMVTESRRYISDEDFANDLPEQVTVTEMYGLSADTILTHVNRDGITDTYTFRLPVITRTVNEQTGSVRVVRHFGRGGAVVSETTYDNGTLIQRRITTSSSDGSIITRTEYPDASWRQTRVLGQFDGTILREITSGN
jgi:hypothetical protein